LVGIEIEINLSILIVLLHAIRLLVARAVHIAEHHHDSPGIRH